MGFFLVVLLGLSDPKGDYGKTQLDQKALKSFQRWLKQTQCWSIWQYSTQVRPQQTLCLLFRRTHSEFAGSTLPGCLCSWFEFDCCIIWHDLSTPEIQVGLRKMFWMIMSEGETVERRKVPNMFYHVRT